MSDDMQNATPPAVAPACPNDNPPESQTPKRIKKRQTSRNKRKLKPRLRLLRAQMLIEQNHRCAHCGCTMITEPHHPNSATLDHIIPRARALAAITADKARQPP